MKKQVMFSMLILIVLLVTSLALAQEDEEDETQELIDTAYQCLEDSLGSGCEDLTNSEAQAYAVLALGDKQCADRLLENSDNAEETCWPSGSCKVRDTAIAMMALDRINKDTTKIKEWLLDQTMVATSLIWYIEIDADEATTCDVTRDTTTTQITINEDKTINSISDNCLSLSTGDYWLKLNSNCIDEEFTISCDKLFKTTLLYQTQSSSTIHVSQLVNQAEANSFTTEKISFQCFQQGSVCNYESTLWATLALKKQGESILNYLPYLKAFASENRGDFPEAFLHLFTGDPDYLSSTISNNFKGNFWQVGSKNKEYNSALAFMSLGESAIPEVEKSKTYFLNNQDADNCWNTPTDTARLLYTAWPKAVSSSGGTTGGGGGGGTTPTTSDCRSNNGYCTTLANCPGSIFTTFDCINPGKVCCSEPEELETCSELGGQICDVDEQCFNTNYVDSVDAPFACCQSTCEDIPQGDPGTTFDTNLCQDNDGTCRSFCDEDDEEQDFSLSCGETSNQICCQEKSGSLIWVWVLLILIVVVIILILLRKKIKLGFFKMKSKFKKKPSKPTRPAGLPPPGRVPPMALRPTAHHRPIPKSRPATHRPVTKSSGGKDKDFEDTLKKLREMSK